MVETLLGKYILQKMKKGVIGSVRELARKSDISHSELNYIIRGKRLNPNPKILKKIAKALGVSYDELMTAAGYIKDNDDTFIEDTSVKFLPILGIIRAGQPLYAEENIIGLEPVNKKQIKGGEYFFLQVTGDSMVESGICEGSTVLVRKQDSVENGEVAIVMIDDEDATIKRVYYDTDTIVLKPDNSKYNPLILKIDRVKILGKVIRAQIDPNKRKR